MPVKRLPSEPDLNHLKYQARDLMKLHAAGDVGAAQRIREFNPKFRAKTDAEIFAASLKLSDAQLTIARERGFKSWARLREKVLKTAKLGELSRELPLQDRIEDAGLRRAVNLVDAGDVEGLRRHLEAHKDVTRRRANFEGGNYFRTPTLLEFVAENPVRHGKLPGNIAEIAKTIIDAGVERAALNETLGLVATGRVPRECGVQVALIDLLCDAGAEADGALRGAVFHGEHDAVEALLRRGARMDLAAAAALGRVDEFRRLLAGASAGERHAALAGAAQFGHTEIVRELLDAGEDPDRYNPPGSHSQSTPLHQAAWAGHEGVVRLLMERGARLDIRDMLWEGTPADWAEHEGRPEMEALLRGREGAK